MIRKPACRHKSRSAGSARAILDLMNAIQYVLLQIAAGFISYSAYLASLFPGLEGSTNLPPAGY